ncbi:Hypothetical predicted protein [Paramuricea clavata]|nr:Hypothetical predicted protein [Paramuricea clavata]
MGNITESFGLTKKQVMDPCTRERDDFNLRKQLDKLVSSCGQPELKLKHEDSISSESDTVCTVVDTNDTLAKMLSKVDDFVASCSGEDLRSSVVKEIKHRYNAKVKAFVSKTTNATKLRTRKGMQVAQNVHLSLGQPVGKKDTDEVPLLNVSPWGGTVNAEGKNVILANTCPIDNFLTIFYALMKMHGSAYQHLSASTHLYASALVRISRLFDAGKFSEGKWEWLKLFPGRFELSERNKVDLWGNEEEMFVSRL